MQARCDDEHTCRERALQVLTARGHSVAELRRKLLTKGFSAAVVEEVLRGLVRVGLLVDLAYARAFCLERLQGGRPCGRMLLRTTLRRRGVADEALAAALADVFSEDAGDAEMEAAMQAGAAKWRALSRRPGADPRRNQAALVRFLQGRGFTGDLCRRVLDRLGRGEEE
mgnify:CR=1 FL=1